MSKTKHDRGLCCWHGCQRKAAYTVMTPGYTKDGELLYCDEHLKLVEFIANWLEEQGIDPTNPHIERDEE